MLLSFLWQEILPMRIRTGGLFGENEVSGTGGGSVFATPGMPTTIFAGMNVTW